MAFGIETDRLKTITDRHAAVLEQAERAIGYALVTDSDISPDELVAVLKWMAAVRFAVMVQAEGRDPHNSDFIALTDAVCEAAAI